MPLISMPILFRCTVCGKTLRSVYYLRLHMFIHTKELPYRCTKCDAAFNRKDKVKRHMLTHDAVKRFKVISVVRNTFHRVPLKDNLELF